MSTDITVAQDMGMSMMEAMGMADLGGSSIYIPRLQQIHEAIMGTMEIGGKKVKTEVVPAGAYKFSPEKDVTVYAVNPKVRIFTMRQQWSKYDADEKRVYKSVLAQDLKGDLKDELGGFNLGRPSGYIADWKALPKETQDIIRSVSRVKVVFGVLELGDALNEAGETVTEYSGTYPFVTDIKSTNSIKALDAALKTVIRKNVMPIHYQFELGSTEFESNNGKCYYAFAFTGGNTVETDPEVDNDTFRVFMDKIESSNKYVLGKWEDKSLAHGMTDAEVDLVAQFVNVDGAD